MLGAPMRKLITKLAIGIVMVSLSNNFKLKALESDKDQQVIWSADGNSAMRITEDRRILEMSNNVIVNQGTLEIRGDRAIFEYEASTNVLKQVQVFGQPVRYQQQLDGDESSVSGVSDSLILSVKDTNIILAIPIPATIKEIPATSPTKIFIDDVKLPKVSIN